MTLPPSPLMQSEYDKGGEWRDISSAPRDGTAIWGCDPEHAYEGKVVFANHEWEFINFSGFGTGTGFYPTIWQPLPKLPAIRRVPEQPEGQEKSK